MSEDYSESPFTRASTGSYTPQLDGSHTRSDRFMSLLITCETGGIEVPASFRGPPNAKLGHALSPSNDKQDASQIAAEDWHISEHQMLQMSSRADHAGRYAAERMSSLLDADLIVHSRALDLIDVSRSLHHRQLFSDVTRAWPKEARQQLIEAVHEPYRDRVRSAVRAALARSSFLIHLSVRSFALRSDGKIRRADAGLLYDPSRKDESDLCHDWVYELWYRAPMLKVRRNYPRRGTSDSLTRTLRQELGDQNYLGIEVQLNRAWVDRKVAIRDEAIAGICESLQAVLEQTESSAQAA